MLPSRVEMLGVESLLFGENQLRYPRAFQVNAGGRFAERLDMEMSAAGVGRGCTIAMASTRDGGISVMVTPPEWPGPEWTPTLDRRWRALEVLAACSERSARLARERYKRGESSVRRARPRTLIPYGASALGGRT